MVGTVFQACCKIATENKTIFHKIDKDLDLTSKHNNFAYSVDLPVQLFFYLPRSDFFRLLLVKSMEISFFICFSYEGKTSKFKKMKVEKYYRQVMFDVLTVCQLISAVLASTWKGKAVGGKGGGGGGGGGFSCGNCC